MPWHFIQTALAQWVCLSKLRQSILLRNWTKKTVAMQQVPSSNVSDCKYHFSIKSSSFDKKVEAFQNEEIKKWCLKNIYPGSTIVSDGLQCFNAVVEAKCIHETHIVGGGKKAVEHPSFKWVNTILGNVKNSLTGTYHAFAQKHVPRYLAEFQYRFNHRFNLTSMIRDLIQISLMTPPMPERLLTLAEQKW